MFFEEFPRFYALDITLESWLNICMASLTSLCAAGNQLFNTGQKPGFARPLHEPQDGLFMKEFITVSH